MTDSRSDTVSLVVAALTELILTGQLSAGDQVVEADIAARVGVSRTPVREAIGQLVTRGLLVKQNNRSARVHRPSLDDLMEIYEMRTLLECHIARKAALAPERERLAELQELEAQLRSRAEADDDWFDVHSRFHRSIVLLTGRPQFLSTIEMLQHQSEPYVRLVTKLDVGRHDQVQHEHHELTRAIVDGDADRAEELTRLHLTSTVERVSRIFEAAGRYLIPAERPRDQLK